LPDPVNSQKPDDGPERRVGTLIRGKWTVDALLGVGGMVSVDAASHRNGQRAALKVLHSDFARDKTICDRFLREGYVSNKIGHPACVAVLDDDRTDDEAPFLVMELLEGYTVRDLWKKAGRRMPIPEILRICDDILDCLIACHAIGVIHRDLKPANIFVTNAQVTKVLDFGVAQMRSATSERTATGTALGTPAYMSPEQAMGLVDQLDGRADIFSVGAMMHALTTGHRINNGRTENEALVMAATTPVPSVARIAPDLPVELVALIDKSLAWDRRNRFENAQQMQAKVREVRNQLTGATPMAGRTGPAEIEIPPMEGEAQQRRAPRGAAAFGLLQVQQAAVAQAQGVAPGLAPSIAPGRPPPPPPPPAAPAPPVAPVVPAPPVLAAEDDPRVDALRDLFKRIERLLPNVRQFGWGHPATERAMIQTYDGFVEAIAKDPQVVDFSIRPYSMLHRGQTVWEPVAPFDSIPYNFFACGMRAMRMTPGLTLDELRGTFTLMLTDPGRELPPEDDLAAAFWERRMLHVQYDVVDAFAEGDAAEREAFYSESDAVEQMAVAASTAHINRLEARAMVVSTDRSALTAGKSAGPMAVEEAVKAVFQKQLVMPSSEWSQRYVDAVVDGYVDAAVHRDAPLILASLRKSTADLVVAGRMGIGLELHNAIILKLGEKLQGQNLARLSSALTNAMFGGETLELALRHVIANPDMVTAFAPILDVIHAGELRYVLASLKQGPSGASREMLLRFIERALAGMEAEVASVAVGLDPENVYAILSLLAKVGTPEARQAILLMAQSEDENVKVEARALAAGDAAHAELTAMCENASSITRMAAARAAMRYGVKGAWSAIARQIKLPDFNERGSDERKEFLRALIGLSPEKGEPIALELAKKGGVFVSDAREGTRVAAAEALGEISRSREVAAALRELAQSRWGTSEETRSAAAAAADLISERLTGNRGPSKPPPGGGSGPPLGNASRAGVSS
jgi:eukaryotic-like serine/threonine-protein kinase